MLLLLARVAAAGTCSAYLDLETVATLDGVPELRESSGLAVSRSRGLLYTHQDSGSSAQIFAFEADGTSRGVHAIEGAGAVDWEDMALGPCPDDAALDCLYIADVGDNPRSRESVQVYAVREPAADGEALPVIATWDVVYPERARDAEALAVHPLTGRVYLATKDMTGDEEIFVLPAAPTAPGETGALTPVARFFIDTEYDRLVTGAAWDAEGERFALRTYLSALEWTADPASPDTTWASAPRAWPVDGQGQGEAITYDRGSKAILLSSEGNPMPLDRLPCADDAPADSGAESGLQDTGPRAVEAGCGCGGGSAAGLALPLGLSALARRRTSARRRGSGPRPSPGTDR